MIAQMWLTLFPSPCMMHRLSPPPPSPGGDNGLRSRQLRVQVWRQPQLFPLDWKALSNAQPGIGHPEACTKAGRDGQAASLAACRFQRALAAIISGNPGDLEPTGDFRGHGNHKKDLFNRAAGVAPPPHQPAPASSTQSSFRLGKRRSG